MQYLNSSAIWALQYNPATRTLTVWFTSSSSGYDYYGVPESVYHGFLQASSKGRYFNLHIREQYAA